MKNSHMRNGSVFIVLILAISCKVDHKPASPAAVIAFQTPVKVSMTGYTGNMMEPFISRDGKMLLFNNLNAAPENTNLQWATKINDSTFQYKGEIAGVNTADLEGVPSMDSNGKLYFVSTRNYTGTLSTLYQSSFSNGVASNVQLITGISRLQAGWVNFDIEVSADGQTIYFVDGQIDQTGIPSTADLVIARKTAAGFQRLSNSNEILKNINTGDLEYAAGISANQLELYFTRLALPITASSSPELFVAVRNTMNETFGTPFKISSISGFVEAATIAPDQNTIYFHKKEGGVHVLYMAKKK